jgi:hypothetical protein
MLELHDPGVKHFHGAVFDADQAAFDMIGD